MNMTPFDFLMLEFVIWLFKVAANGG